MRILSVVSAAAFLLASLVGCPHTQALDGLDATATSSTNAELELRAAREAAEHGDGALSARRYQQFLHDHPNDPLCGEASLGLGQILLADGDIAGATRYFDRVAALPDPHTAEKGRFYRGIALAVGGNAADARTLLEPFVGKTIAPNETALLYRTLAAVYAQLGDSIHALLSLDAILHGDGPESEKAAARTRIDMLATDELSADDVQRAADTLAHTSYAWSVIAKRALREAHARHDLARVRHLTDELREAGIDLDPDLQDMAMRAEMPEDVNAQAIGVILPLSGRLREVGQRAMKALLLASGVPTTGPLSPTAARIVPRDSAGDPVRAAHAVEDLVSMHRVIAIVGAIDGREAQAAAIRARELQVPFITLSASGDVGGGDMIFHAVGSAADEVTILVRAAIARGAHRFALVRPDTAFGSAMEAVYTAKVRALGGETLAAAVYPAGTTSFGPLAAKMATESFDAVFVADAPRVAVNIVSTLNAAFGARRDAAERHAPLVMLAQISFDGAAMRLAGHGLDGALLSVAFDPTLATEEAQQFLRAYRAANNFDPDVFAAAAFDAYTLLRRVIDGGARSRADAAAALIALPDAPTLSSLGGFTPTGEPRHITRLYEIRNATPVLLP